MCEAVIMFGEDNLMIHRQKDQQSKVSVVRFFQGTEAIKSDCFR